MVKRSLKKIDLLRKKREANNLARPYFVETKKYIKRGVFSGFILIVISLTLGIPFIFRIEFLESKKNDLKIFSDEYDLLEKKLKKEKKQIKQITRFNKTLKNSIFNISSSSALFQEIALIIPKKIQIFEFISKDNSLSLKAKVPNKENLEIINSFLINLDKSELIKFNDIDLKGIRSLNRNSKAKEYAFEINTKISTEFNDINEKYLIKLGSYGLFNRLNNLKDIDASFD